MGFENPAKPPAPSRDATGGKLSGLSATTRDRTWTFVGHTRISFEKTHMITSDTWTDHDTFEGTGSVDTICSPASTQNSEQSGTLADRTQPTGPTEACRERIFDPVCGASHNGRGIAAGPARQTRGAVSPHRCEAIATRRTAPPEAFPQVRSFFLVGRVGLEPTADGL
ncbi:hypothetical protein [Streptomyces sp. NPDC007117]|uniref:hypothetical protein n=1 Tax=unclassified Streptomyces TaxID=2593676 RepID=UPI0033CE80C8